jgi:uncharacterized membrane protein YqjE
VTSPFDTVRRLSAASVSLLLSRAEFATLELAQARAQWMRWVLLALLATLLALLALLAASTLLVLALWERFGWITLLAVGIAYALAAVFVLRRLDREIAAAPPLLAQTLQEVARDRDALFGRDRDGGRAP